MLLCLKVLHNFKFGLLLLMFNSTWSPTNTAFFVDDANTNTREKKIPVSIYIDQYSYIQRIYTYTLFLFKNKLYQYTETVN